MCLNGKLNKVLDNAFIEAYPYFLSGSKYVPSDQLFQALTKINLLSELYLFFVQSIIDLFII